MRFVAVMTAVVATVASFLAVLVVRSVGASVPHVAAHAGPHVSTASPRPHIRTSVEPAATTGHVRLGITAYDLPGFERRTSIIPAITAKYYDWGTPFPSSEVLADHGAGTTTLVVLEPRDRNLKRLAAGKYDAYLKEWANADRELGLPIILSFAPEANGDWYPWGKGHIAPALYRKIFQHVHNVLVKDGARHVTWLWQVDRSSSHTEPLSLIWPGRAFVNAIGLDGQLNSGRATFTTVFGSTLKEVRAFTKVPVMLSEVGIVPSPSRPKQVTALFGAAHKAPLSALVFFDVSRWTFDTDKATISSIRSAAIPRK